MSAARAMSELDCLLNLVGHSPDDLRRIAELTELVFDLEAALPWWRMAAATGDEDSIDYLKVVAEEGRA